MNKPQRGMCTGARSRWVLYLAAAIIVGLFIVNLGVDIALRAAGLVESTNSVVPVGDPFADYFRFVVSYPGGEHVTSSIPQLAERLSSYQAANPPAGAQGLLTGKQTHFNAPPINTLFGLANVFAMRWIEPALLFLSFCAALFGYWSAIVRRHGLGSAGQADWIVLGMLAYPTLMVVVRGNIYAGATGLLIVHALLLRRQEAAPRLSAVLLAVAISMRPNAIAFAVPLVALRRTDRGVIALTLVIAATALNVGAMALAHLAYPDYGAATFLAGLRSYHANSVTAGWGIAYGSSLYGGLAALFGINPLLEAFAFLPAGAIGLGAILLHARGSLGDTAYLFLIAAAYCLGTTVIADYHLFVFMLPVLVAALTADRAELKPSDIVAVVASCLMLAPKNYLYHGDVSIQPVLNPLILLAASSAIEIMGIVRRSAKARLGAAWPSAAPPLRETS